MTTVAEVREAEQFAKRQREALAARPKPCGDCPGPDSLLCCRKAKSASVTP